MPERGYAENAAGGGLLSLLYRLRRGDSVMVGTDTGPLRSPRQFTVERIAEERSARDDEIYYRVHLRGSRDGRYVVMPEKPQGKGAHVPPELFYQHPNDSDRWDEPAEDTEGSVVFLRVTAGAPISTE
ncbi:hypothetical protein V5735_07000 (plasmid) [Haladaptatus sp. SPP-AMP-3]|uniref:hypothetical protein n=1 Tax=Haladaptatus sp. SPP-AMP-3 TaxID=3121295 RepID=UPI003C2EFB78